MLLLCLGSPGVCQLNLLPGRVTGIPSEFQYHLFHYLNHKEHASIKKQPAQQLHFVPQNANVACIRGCTGEFSMKKISKLYFSKCNVVDIVCLMNTHQDLF